VDAVFLCSQIQKSAPEEVDNVVSAFEHDRDASLMTLHSSAAKGHSAQDWRFKARLAVVALHLGDDAIAADMCRIEDRPDPVQRTIFVDEFPVWHGDLKRLVKHCEKLSDPALQSAACLGVGGIPAERLAPADTVAWRQILSEWYQTTADNATHSAAGWALRQWQIVLPALANSSQPDGGRNWFVNSLGMTLLKIRPGQFVRHDELPEPKEQTVILTHPFYLCDREVTFGRFRRFYDDPQCPPEEKPAIMHQFDQADSEANSADMRDHPQVSVNWYDTVLFCNWLSRKEGLEPCYERTGKKERIQTKEYDAWQLIANGTGYRLPTEAEWEYACCAGTTTDFACGSDQELLRKYAVFQSSHSAPVGSKLPNGWGLFDMHGNPWEWCYDWYGAYGAGDVSDPLGPSEPSVEASFRVNRGGSWFNVASACRSASRSWIPPGYRDVRNSFRVARSSVR
jgi:formylglycine-generating enzyme required for sulfatase activity